jgi:hypothetical protein
MQIHGGRTMDVKPGQMQVSVGTRLVGYSGREVEAPIRWGCTDRQLTETQSQQLEHVAHSSPYLFMVCLIYSSHILELVRYNMH